ncbi:MAG: glutathione S-transferase N-terminal domain-containing protein [Verrucomicrobiota bacterium]
MIELIQFPWSPFCIVTRRILEFGRIPHKITDIPNGDRSLVWRLSKERYYQVPLIRDGRNVIFETDENSQVIAKYLNEKFQLGLFPPEWRGLQSILWQHIESEIEGPCFKLDDIYWKELVPKSDQLRFLRHKERKFGRGCLDAWRTGQKDLLRELSDKLIPFEQMLLHKPFLLDGSPRFVDFNLFGMLSNFLYSGHYKLPAAHANVNKWFAQMSKMQLSPAKLTREKLRP